MSITHNGLWGNPRILVTIKRLSYIFIGVTHPIYLIFSGVIVSSD